EDGIRDKLVTGVQTCALPILRSLEADETLLVQSGKPVGIFRTHENAPRVLIANSNLVPHWGTWEKFHELDRKGLMMYGQMTAGRSEERRVGKEWRVRWWPQ